MIIRAMHARIFAIVLFAFLLPLLLSATARAAVQPGDKIQVHVFNYPDLSITATVDSSGAIDFPLAGRIVVRGLNASQIAAALQKRLSLYIRKPAVDAQRVAEGTSIFVSGGPGGTLPYQPGQSLATILTQVPKLDGADVLHSRIDLHHVGLNRDGKRIGTYDIISISAAGGSSPLLEAGDTIVLINKPVRVNVVGEVANPGATFLEPDEPLSDAIGQVGGLLPTAAASGIVLSEGPGTSTVALGDIRMTQPAQQGETLRIPVAPRIVVAGMVGTPGPVTLRSNFSLLSALYLAGGPNKYGNLRAVQVIRAGVRNTYDITALVHGDLSQDPDLADGDIVFVPEGHKIDFTTVLQTLANLHWALAL